MVILFITGAGTGLLDFQLSNFVFAFIFTFALIAMKAGGGDIKFALIALPFFLPKNAISQYLTYFAIVAATQLLIHWTYLYFFKKSTYKSHYLALGPALAGALALVLS